MTGAHRRPQLRGATGLEMRDVVAARLEDLCCEGGPLDASGPNQSVVLFGRDPNREDVLSDVLDEYLSLPGEFAREGRCVVLTAGPPSAGKTTEVQALGLGCRVVDADVFKDLLIRRALVDGTYDQLLEHLLPDGSPILPRELAGLFHAESTTLLGDAMRVCTERRENLVVEGTLRWDRIVTSYLQRLAEQDYRRLQILSCELPLSDAQARALDRWWTGRITEADQGLGGRFVPSRVIDELYPKTVDLSACRDNALRMFDEAKGQFEEVLLVMSDPGSREEVRHSPAV